MKKIVWITTSILLITLVSCNTIYNAVSVNYDDSIDFSKYKTFAWLPDKADTINTPYNNQLIRKNIRKYFGQCMSDRAYSLDRKHPDLLMQLVIRNSTKKITVNNYTSSYYNSPPLIESSYNSTYNDDYYSDYSVYDYDYLNDLEYSADPKETYVNGAISLNIIDRETKKIVWSGTAKGNIYDPAEIDLDLHPAVHRLLNEYPVKPLVRRSHKIR